MPDQETVKSGPEAVMAELKALTATVNTLTAKVEALSSGRAGTSAPMAQDGATAILTKLDEIGVHPGLCDKPTCTPCRTAATSLVRATENKVRRDVFAELDQAAVWGGAHAEADKVAEVFDKWFSAGKPKPAEAQAEEIVAGLGV